jgi:sugar phosphate isomerase/epimerase
MVDIAGAHGCRYVLENVAGSWADTGTHAVSIINRVGRGDELGLCWDPANSSMAGSALSTMEEYAQLKSLVASVHCKNCNGKDGKWTLMEGGVVDWPAQLSGLSQIGYDGYLVIETHLQIRNGGDFVVVDEGNSDLEQNTSDNLKYLRQSLRAAAKL